MEAFVLLATGVIDLAYISIHLTTLPKYDPFARMVNYTLAKLVFQLPFKGTNKNENPSGRRRRLGGRLSHSCA